MLDNKNFLEAYFKYRIKNKKNYLNCYYNSEISKHFPHFTIVLDLLYYEVG